MIILIMVRFCYIGYWLSYSRSLHDKKAFSSKTTVSVTIHTSGEDWPMAFYLSNLKSMTHKISWTKVISNIGLPTDVAVFAFAYIYLKGFHLLLLKEGIFFEALLNQMAPTCLKWSH